MIEIETELWQRAGSDKRISGIATINYVTELVWQVFHNFTLIDIIHMYNIKIANIPDFLLNWYLVQNRTEYPLNQNNWFANYGKI